MSGGGHTGIMQMVWTNPSLILEPRVGSLSIDQPNSWMLLDEGEMVLERQLPLSIKTIRWF